MTRRERQKVDTQVARSKDAALNPDSQSSDFAENSLKEISSDGVLYPSFTLELALYVAILTFGAFLRFFLLSSNPLESSESLRAISAWQLVRLEPPSSWNDPLVISSTAASFFLFGANDIVARLQPALIGSALAFLPWFLRNRIGRVGALGSSLLVATSPTLIYYSRTLSSDIYSLFFFTALVCLILNWEFDKERYWVLSATLLALLLASGSSAISYLVVGILSIVLFASTGNRAEGLYRSAYEFLQEHQDKLITTFAVFAGVLIIFTTAFFTRLEGFTFVNLSPWMSQFDLSTTSSPWYFPLLALIIYEPVVLLVGLAGIFMRLQGGWDSDVPTASKEFLRLLSVWVVVGIVLAFAAGQKSGAQTMVVVLPLALCGGYFIEQALTRFASLGLWRATRLSLGLAPLLVFTFFLINQFSNSGFTVAWYQWGLLGMSLAVTVGSTVVAAGQNRWGNVTASVALGGLLLIPYSFHVNSWLSYRTSGAEFLPSSVSSSAVIDSVDIIKEQMNIAGAGSNFSILVDEGLKYPFAWYLRGISRVTYSSKISAGPNVVIAKDDDKPKPGFENYATLKTPVSSRFLVSSLLSDRLWRWLIQREPIGPVSSINAVTYFK